MDDVKISDERIIQILKTYKNGKAVPENEFSLVEKYSSIGIIHIGFSFSKREIQAKLTKSGKKILGIEGKKTTRQFKLH